jgi:hypothetical protein
MKQVSLRNAAIAVSTFACAALLSFGWSEQRGVSLSVESAQARVGHPLTPVSGAGVARRQARRAAYGPGVVGAGVAGAAVAGAALGAAAIGTAGAIAASPYNYGGRTYYGAGPYFGNSPYYGTSAAYAYYRPYGVWDQEYARRSGFVCRPGTLVKMDDGLMHVCQ